MSLSLMDLKVSLFCVKTIHNRPKCELFQHSESKEYMLPYLRNQFSIFSIYLQPHTKNETANFIYSLIRRTWNILNFCCNNLIINSLHVNVISISWIIRLLYFFGRELFNYDLQKQPLRRVLEKRFKIIDRTRKFSARISVFEQ